MKDDFSTTQHMLDSLCSGHMIVFPYDRDPGTSVPSCYEGEHSHYCVIVGFGFEERKESNDDSHSHERATEPTDFRAKHDGDLDGVFFIAQHGSGKQFLVEKSELWLKSNGQLNPSERTMRKFAGGLDQPLGVANLAGKYLVL